MSKTTIEWTEQTWNPVRGCSPVSPGCANCYAERQGGRFCGPGRPFDGFIQMGKNGVGGPHWTGKVELIEHMLDIPLRTRKPTTWFVNSMSDLFHEELSDETIDRVFAVMALCTQHTFQVLTKRSKRMREYFNAEESPYFYPCTRVEKLAREMAVERDFSQDAVERDWPLPNVWLGASVEDQQRADERIPDLLQTPAAVRFLSCEPLLGSINLRCVKARGAGYIDSLDGIGHDGTGEGRHLMGDFLDWVIVGGESGPGARPFDIAWARSIVQQCKDAGVPCFVKQLGARPRGPEQSVPDWVSKLNKKGGNWEVWPEALRVRQMPEIPA